MSFIGGEMSKRAAITGDSTKQLAARKNLRLAIEPGS